MHNIRKFISNQISRHIDKITHALACFGLLYFVAHKTGNVELATGVAILFGVAKEFYDLYIKKSKFSVGDLVADVAGIVAAILIF